MWYTVCGILYSSGILYTVRALHLLFSSALGGAQDGLLHWSHWSYSVVLNAVVGVTPLAGCRVTLCRASTKYIGLLYI